jgi:hypothetical protein
MSNDLEITILKPVENFVLLKNKIRKEMSETPAEDLEAYKRFEWEKWSEEWGNSWDNIKNGATEPNLLAQVRDVLGYSVEQYPCTKEEIDAAYAKAKKERAERKEADRLARVQQLKEAQEAFDRLTPEEQSAQLEKNRKEAQRKFVRNAITLSILVFVIVFVSL